MENYRYLKGAKKGIPASIGAALTVKLDAKMGLDPTMAILLGGWLTNFVWDIIKRKFLVKWFGKK